MSSIVLPDYHGRGLANLMQSIATACGSGHRLYPQLAALTAEPLARARHVILLLIDGLGLRTLTRSACAGHLQRHLIGTITSVFPSTTASAITTVMTGLAPAHHGLTGWHMHMEEIDQTLAILPLTPRVGPARRSPEDLPVQLFGHDSLFQALDRDCWVVSPKSIAGSAFNVWHARGARTAAYTSLAELCACLVGLIEDNASSRYIYAYYPELDSCSHHCGTDSRQAQQTLAAIDRVFGELLHRLRGSGTWLLLTADHGFIDSPARRVIDLADHPELAGLLSRPLCGERRVAYCYVAPDNPQPFESYVRRRLGRAAHVHVSEQLIGAGWFGPPPANPRLASRTGDYTLLMKDNWTIKDWLPGEQRFAMLGVHGGLSAAEMRVPLVGCLV
ncbi:alkaline phosphatase family protein [Accumulibacter sp.]|uniref:alkaline phosphatase family protein n=1 Tax=Accumulibacter sp. TaxID=2053492 RepID=UPI0025FAC70C|nr:alkaline phosphatase family protein [Accumulibacter sp.]MCM8626675.1 alkaline phosphatase family protein [Accumulibacter sp.]